MGENVDPADVAIYKSGADKAAIRAINAGRGVPILVRQIKYLNRVVEWDHCAIEHIIWPMRTLKSFRTAGSMLADIEPIQITRRRQFAIDGADEILFANQSSMLAGMVRPE